MVWDVSVNKEAGLGLGSLKEENDACKLKTDMEKSIASACLSSLLK